jgi:hypothetical protein
MFYWYEVEKIIEQAYYEGYELGYMNGLYKDNLNDADKRKRFEEYLKREGLVVK